MLRTRVATAIVLVATLLAFLYLASPEFWIALCAVATAIAGWEWGRLTGISDAKSTLYSVALAIFSATVAAYRNDAVTIVVLGSSVAFWLFVAPLWLRDRSLMKGTTKLLIAGAVILLATCIALVRLQERGAGVLLSVMAIIWISDTVAFFVGRRFGKKKLAPAVSPGKSWEGVGGALAAVAIFAILWWSISPETLPLWIQHAPATPLVVLLLWIILAAFGILGDLLESQLKRIAGVKDSSRLLPGHGGVLDRVDALTAALPLAALIYLIR